MEKTTIDHEEIMRWAEKHSAKPQAIDNPQPDMIGIRLDFPGKKDEAFLSREKPPVDITWEKFFRIFEDEGLAFVYQEKGFDQDPSFSYRFIKRIALQDNV